MIEELICPICLSQSSRKFIPAPVAICGVFDCPGTPIDPVLLKKARFVNKRSKKRSWIVYGNA